MSNAKILNVLNALTANGGGWHPQIPERNNDHKI